MNAFHSIVGRIPSSETTVHHRTAANLRRWRAALAKLRAGTGHRPRIVLIGDSKTMGAGSGETPVSGGNVFTDGAEARSKSAQLVRQLAAAGIAASRQSFFASSGLPSPAAKSLYDPRLSIPAGWSGGSQTLGGVCWATNGNSPFAFTPEGPIDRIEVFAGAFPASVAYTVNVDGGATLATVTSQDAVHQVKKTVVSPVRGPHTINLARSAGDYLNLVGMIAQDTTVPAVDVVNAGAYGTVSAYHVDPTKPINAGNCLAVLAPDLVVVQLGTNDLRTGVPVETAIGHLATLVGKAKAAGADVILEVPAFGTVAGTDTAERRTALRAGLLALGASSGCVVVDHDARLGDYASANGLGLHRDGVPHETGAGYAEQAHALAGVLAG